jgi:hypothetical protein
MVTVLQDGIFLSEIVSAKKLKMFLDTFHRSSKMNADQG